MNKLKTLEEQAKGIVDKVSNLPQSRYQLRYEFYQKYGNPIINSKEGLGNSELAFIKWEIKRGTLNAMNAPQSGSLWWRKVNSHFLYVATLAQLIHESGETFQNISEPINFWLEFIKSPNERSWYRAHNSSIISGYSIADELASKESIYEQYFMNIVLYRVLYAQSMVEGVSFGLLGEIFANPRGYAVSIITDIESFYPSHYPLSKEDIKYVTHRAHNIIGALEDIFDKVFILPHLDALYAESSKWNKSPLLLEFANNNKPIYPIAAGVNNEEHFSFKIDTVHIPNS